MSALIQALNQVLAGNSLTRTQAFDVMNCLTAPDVITERAAAILIALRMKSESVEEVTGFVQSLQAQAVRIEYSPEELADNLPANRPENLMDVCGTGGGRGGTFNVSTTVAFLLAASGQAVAKHGNRKVSSRSGSFDVLEALGIGFNSNPTEVKNAIRTHGLGFLYAPAFHPVLKNLALVRANLGVHTVFNLLGPLLNPMQVRRQVIGVYEPRLLGLMPQVLQRLGSIEVMVVHGDDGDDELSITSPTQVAHLKDGQVRCYTVTPEEVGLRRANAEEIRGGSPEANAEIILKIFRGEMGARRDLVTLNCAAALVVGGKVSSLKDGVSLAQETIDSGRALKLLTDIQKARS